MEISAQFYPHIKQSCPLKSIKGSYIPLKNRELPYDTVSFGALKKNEFSGIDFLVVEKFKAPIEKFNSKEDFDLWAEEKSKNIMSKEYEAKNDDAKIQREFMLNEWKTHIESKKNIYTPAERLLIYDGITKDLKPYNATIPPVLNKLMLSDTINNLKESLKINPKGAFNFSKIYNNNLRQALFKESNEVFDKTGWIKIPSKKHDAENFTDNVDKLKVLSHNAWCTKSGKAESYLSAGDFHIYFDKGEPKLGIRFDGNKIIEIQGERNDGKIPLKYLKTFLDFVQDNKITKYNLSRTATDELNSALSLEKQVKKVKKELKANNVSLEIKNNDFESIFNYFGIKTKKDKDGMLVLSHFDEPKEVTFEDLGINEDNLFKNVSKIEGNAKFCRSPMNDLGNLQEIGGDAALEFSKIKSLGKLKRIGGNFETGWDKLEDTGELQEIGGNVIMHSFAEYEFTNLKKVKGNFDLGRINIIKSLGSIEEIGGDLLHGQEIEDLGNLKKIGGNADFTYANITKPLNIEYIEGNANFEFADVEGFGKLEYIGGDLNLAGADVKDFGNIKEIKGKITALNEYKTKLEDAINANNPPKCSILDKLLGRDKKYRIEKNSFSDEWDLRLKKTTHEVIKDYFKPIREDHE